MERSHQLIFSLLFPISLFLIAIPLLLLQIISTLYSLLISSCIVLLINILSQAICTGPKQLQIAATLSFPAQLIIYIEYPISLIVSKIVRLLFGAPRKSKYSSEDLKEMIELLYQSDNKEEQKSTNLRKRLLSGAISIKGLIAEKIMRNYDEVIAINLDEPLTESFIMDLRDKGYSRCPVYKEYKHQVIGVLLIKKLIGLSRFGITLRKLNMKFRRPLVISPNKSLIELLVEFRKGRSHMAVVTDNVTEVQDYIDLHMNSNKPKPQPDDLPFKTFTIKGIVTLEDVIERALGV